MKKQIRSKNKKSPIKTQLENYTKPSSRKPHKKITKRKCIDPKVVPVPTLCPNITTS